MKAGWLVVCMAVLGSAPAGFADDCGNPDTPATYQAQPDDRINAKSLDVSRSFAGVHALTVNACQGELRIRPTASSALHLEVTAENAAQPLDKYLHDFTVENRSAKVSVLLPSRYHPVITVYVPAESSLQSEINLGAGSLTFYADRIRGKRELNVGAGHAVVFLDADRDYANLEANVGMGSFHDERPGGSSAHFIVARSMQGSGAGDLEIDVGAGEISLKAAR